MLDKMHTLTSREENLCFMVWGIKCGKMLGWG